MLYNDYDEYLALTLLEDKKFPELKQYAAVAVGRFQPPNVPYFGYVYIWFDTIRNKFCIGSHHGKLSDGYLTSSINCKRAILKRPETFRFNVLEFNFENCKKQTLTIEQKWLSKIKNEELGKKYYNLKKYAAGGNTVESMTYEQKEKWKRNVGIASKNQWNLLSDKKREERLKKSFGKGPKNRDYMKTEKYSKNMSNAVLGKKNGFYGKKHNLETRMLWKESRKGLENNSRFFEIVDLNGNKQIIKNLKKFFIESNIPFRNISKFIKNEIPIQLKRGNDFPLNGFLIRRIENAF
jgi:hypothetical protein